MEGCDLLVTEEGCDGGVRSLGDGGGLRWRAATSRWQRRAAMEG